MLIVVFSYCILHLDGGALIPELIVSQGLMLNLTCWTASFASSVSRALALKADGRGFELIRYSKVFLCWLE